MDKNRRTPLSYAAVTGRVDIAAALAGKGGVDPNIRNIEGKAALIHATEHNQRKEVSSVLSEV
ncbi:hypothetical protein F4805DRAFT_416189 [Annulohypoxylon moriforme]|nr:hypothetical protein F4805DRAFT_416189 [Annulohypoxylon moriforme]